MKRSVLEAVNQLELLRPKITALGITIRISELVSRVAGTVRVGTQHWQFNNLDDDRRILDWWPGTGRWRNPSNGAYGFADCVDELIDLCSRIKKGK